MMKTDVNDKYLMYPHPELHGSARAFKLTSHTLKCKMGISLMYTLMLEAQRTIKVLLSIPFLLFSVNSYAGNRIGSGAVVIHDGKGIKNARVTDNGKIASSVEDMLSEEACSFSFSYQAYPNPVLDELNLRISSQENGEISFRVYDMLGRLVHKSQYHLQEGNNRVELNTSEWEIAQGKLMFQVQSPSQGVHWMPLLKK